MIIVQKYHSSREIDPEFIGPLEELMGEHMPSLEWLNLQENLSPENVHFAYYLFFGNAKNSPVGFAQAAIENEEAPGKQKRVFIRKKNIQPAKIKKVRWMSLTSSREGLVFDPAFLKTGLEKFSQLLDEYDKREEVKQQELLLGDECFGRPEIKALPSAANQSIANCLVKNVATYQEYLQSLPEASQKEIKQIWREVYQKPDNRIGEYSRFKECFSYKKEGSKQYKELRKDSKLAPYIKLADTFLTFESPDRVFAIVFLFRGKRGQLFFKPHALDDSIPEGLLAQSAIMHFYEDRESSKLRFVESVESNGQLERWGFTHKNLRVVEYRS